MTVVQLKVSELTNDQLDACVAHIEGRATVTEEAIKAAGCDDFQHYWRGRTSEIRYPDPPGQFWSPSRDWRVGGPIIERERIGLNFYSPNWKATMRRAHGWDGMVASESGPTPLVAAMRAFVAAKVGHMVELPV